MNNESFTDIKIGVAAEGLQSLQFARYYPLDIDTLLPRIMRSILALKLDR